MTDNPVLFRRSLPTGTSDLTISETADGSGIAVKLVMASGASTVCAAIILREGEATVLADSLSRWVKDKRAERDV